MAITLIALVPRLLAAIFSEGYFAHDDHFLVIEAAASWVDGFDYNRWLPWNQGDDPVPSGHSFVYVGLHYLLFSLLKAIGMVAPTAQMVVVRIVHALFSLVVVRAGYRISQRLYGPDIAWRTGLFLAMFWFMPFLAVRNLVEVACIPFLMLGAWRLVKREGGASMGDLLVAGLWIGMAINIRFQAIFFAVGPGLALLLQGAGMVQRLKAAATYGIGLLIPLVVLQGGIDLFLWGRPFAEIGEYVAYNMQHSTTYFDQPFYNYLLLLAGVFIPPLSLALLFGFFRHPRPLLLWLPLLTFLAIHSWFPNKQERFIFPMLPLYFTLAFGAWEMWRARSAYWQRHELAWKRGMAFTWSLNLLLLAGTTFTFSKRSRVEALGMMREIGPVRGIVVEDTAEGEVPLPPLFYWGHWGATVLPWTDPGGDLAAELQKYAPEHRPEMVLFFGLEDLESRRARVESVMGPLEELGRAEPGFVDRVVHWLNPVNRNETIVLTRPVER